MIHLSAGKILEYQLTRSLGLDIYEEIMTAAPVTDVSQSREFQKKFNTFYRIRRNAEWRKDYYELFELAKKGHYPFDDVISLLYVRTGNIEASFSSKTITGLKTGMRNT